MNSEYQTPPPPPIQTLTYDHLSIFTTIKEKKRNNTTYEFSERPKKKGNCTTYDHLSIFRKIEEKT